MLKIEIKKFKTSVLVELQYSFIASTEAFKHLRSKLSDMNFTNTSGNKTGPIYKKVYQLNELQQMSKDIEYFKDLSGGNYYGFIFKDCDLFSGPNYIKS